MYFVYFLRCSDNSLYCGFTNNLMKRLHAHNNLSSGSKYTKTRRPVRLVKYFICNSKSQALKLEYRLKQLSKINKEALIHPSMSRNDPR